MGKKLIKLRDGREIKESLVKRCIKSMAEEGKIISSDLKKNRKRIEDTLEIPRRSLKTEEAMLRLSQLINVSIYREHLTIYR